MFHVWLREGFAFLTESEQLYIKGIAAEIEDLDERLKALKNEREQLLRRGRVRGYRQRSTDAWVTQYHDTAPDGNGPSRDSSLKETRSDQVAEQLLEEAVKGAQAHELADRRAAARARRPRG